MKLLIIAPYFYPKVGGLENYAWNICKGLKEKYGWEIVVISGNHLERKNKQEVIQGIKIYRLAYWFKLSNTPINLGWFIDILRIVKKEKPDKINAHSPVPFIADIGALISFQSNIPFILTYHNDLIKGNMWDIIFKLYYLTLGRLTLEISKIIITTSKFYAENSLYLQNYKSKLEIIPPGVDISKYKPKKIRSDNNTVLFVGQLDKTHNHKGLTYLISAIKDVVTKLPEVKLQVVGKGDNIEEYKSQALRQGVLKNTLFTGYIDDSSLVKAYQESSVVILPSITDSEGFGMTLLEAGACGKPVIGTKVGGIPFVINNNLNGLLVNPKSSAELSKAIITILNDTKLAEKLGQTGYESAIKNYSWEKQVQKTKEVLV